MRRFEAALAEMYEILEEDPDENLPRLLEWLQQWEGGDWREEAGLIAFLRRMRLHVDVEIQKTLLTNVLLNDRHVPGVWLEDAADGLAFDSLDSAVQQEKERGKWWYLVSCGGDECEKHALIALCNKHFDCVFGGLISPARVDKAFAEEALRVENLIPVVCALSEQGTQAMKILRRYRLLCGLVSCQKKP